MKSKNHLIKLLSSNGFTNFELVVVLLVIGIVLAIGVVRFTDEGESDRVAKVVAQLIISDLAFAQEMAVSAGKTVEVVFTPGTDGGDWSGFGCGLGGRRGYGHDPDVRGEGMNGYGRGHGYGWGHLHHNCGPGCGGGTAGGYYMRFSDGTPIPYPAAALIENIRGQVTITDVMRLQFDASGRLITPEYTWADGQTEAVALVLNGTVQVMISRETGKTRVVSG